MQDMKRWALMGPILTILAHHNPSQSALLDSVEELEVIRFSLCTSSLRINRSRYSQSNNDYIDSILPNQQPILPLLMHEGFKSRS